MFSLSTHMLQLISMIAIIVGALIVIVIRLQAAKKPTSTMKIIMPPLGMITGFLMFLVPDIRIPWTYALITFLVGCFFSIPLIYTSHMKKVDGDIYLKRSPTFIFVLLTLLIIRLALDSYIGTLVTIAQTGGMFFILAFGMLLPWRVAMLLRYKKFLRHSQ
ncbi:CcdC family protein [Sulfoacidibacillus ferrooxidans]|uniref:Cytochrome c biogenesis protein CcdC n=1 Tax=Sulfoacidibacillus ferrooxidans TaxID=2005001 RepID=A0A9X2AD62_9BACL|nr:cytochrome c biogenesis protein CcdC [Sulfoacidibacillus ferrooxidans]MCI0184539.1 hypothetical protein [Sulfoacidibacillus ferrooxidans]